MRFASALNVDVNAWTKDSNVIIEREGAGRELKQESASTSTAGDNLEELPRFGAGSEYGKIEREEARAKKFTPRSRKNLDAQPWILKVGGKNGKRYRGIREGGVSENTSYYVFFQAKDGAFEAVPVSQWYNFTLMAKYKALTAEEAEEQFEKRDKMMNFFAVMKGAKKEEDGAAGDSVDGKSLTKKKKDSRGFKVTEMDDWGSGSEGEGSSGGEDEDGPSRKNNRKKKGKKRGSDDEFDSAKEESDEGDFDTREVDYISSSSSEEEEVEEKINRELKGVEDEDALRQLVLSESEEEEDSEANKDKTVVKSDPDAPPQEESSKKAGSSKGGSDSSDSDSEDSDLDDDKVGGSRWTAIFMQKKNGTESDPNSRSHTPIREMNSDSNAGHSDSSSAAVNDAKSVAGVKRKLEPTSSISSSGGTQHPSTSSSSASHAKKMKASTEDEGVSEGSIRRYLLRKPMTTKDLFKIFKKKVKNISDHDLVSQIAEVLKKINPTRENIHGKLYLSLKQR